jgi:hypothetical protein
MPITPTPRPADAPVQVSGQRADVLGDRPVGAAGEGGELPGNAGLGEGAHGVAAGERATGLPEQRRDDDAEPLAHHMVGQVHDCRVMPGISGSRTTPGPCPPSGSRVKTSWVTGPR